MRLIFLGPPGAGKGTQAVLCSEWSGIPHISTGDMLREAIREGGATGRKAKEFMDRGELVPDELVAVLVKERIAKADCRKGFILDGFPRNERQGLILEETLQAIDEAIDRVVYIDTPEEAILARLTGRRSCPECGAVYHIQNNPPAKEGVCDRCGTELISRKDDKRETIEERLRVYKEKTEGLCTYYGKKGMLLRVPGIGSVEAIFQRIKAALGPERDL
jgi:adenylate kinase